MVLRLKQRRWRGNGRLPTAMLFNGKEPLPLVRKTNMFLGVAIVALLAYSFYTDKPRYVR